MGAPHVTTQGDSTTMNVKYSADGNILYKTNVGNYEYGLKPHAVMNVENSIGLIPHASLTTKFNEFGKVERIEDGDTLQSLEVEYGPDQERFLVKDNLGSIVKAYDTDENLVYDASYDAWGKQTVKKDSIGLCRGYCGHEMLNDFNIINMNVVLAGENFWAGAAGLANGISSTGFFADQWLGAQYHYPAVNISNYNLLRIRTMQMLGIMNSHPRGCF